MDIVLIIFFFFLGIIVGSFLNVLVLRLNTGERIVNARSRCFSCGHTLHAGDLIPIISFLLQRGHCRYCKSKFSWQYPVVELLTGIVFLLIAWKIGIEFANVSFSYLLPTIYYLFIFSLLIALAVYDIRHKIIPNEFVYPFIILALFAPFGGGDVGSNIFPHLGAGLAGFLFFGSLWFVSGGRWMGFGDAKLALGMGFLLGPELTLFAIMLAFWIGTLVMLPLLISKRFGMKAEIPFAPFLVAGTCVSWLAGSYFISYVLF